MAAAPVPFSIEEYLHTSFHPDADFVDGNVHKRNVGEIEHSTLQAAIVSWLWVNRREWSIHPVTEQRIQVALGRVRVADVAVLPLSAKQEKVTTTPPIVCVEILSPEDRLSRAKTVLADYLAMGVENVWLIDPLRRAAWVFDSSGLHEAEGMRLFVPNSPVYLDLFETFAALD